VEVSFESLPAGVTIAPVTIPKGESEATATVRSIANRTVSGAAVKVVAVGDAGDAKPRAETSISVQVSDPSRPAQADVIFVLDVTQSMDWAINGLANGIGGFAAHMRENKVDFRVGLVAYRDLWVGEASELLLFRNPKGGHDTFTADDAEFAREVSRLRADGGGDAPESTLDAVIQACEQRFRPGATKVLMIITDNPPKNLHRQGGQTDRGQTASAAEIREAALRVKAANIDFVHLVTPTTIRSDYGPLQEAASGNGQFFELARAARGAGFNDLVSDFSKQVAEAAKAKMPEGKAKVAGEAEKPAVKAVQSENRYAEGSERRLTLAVGVWTGAISALVCLTLLAGQTHYLRGVFPAAGGIVAGLVGGLAVGLVGGAAGQGLFTLAPDSAILANIFRVIGWTLLGGLAGVGLSLFIPNLKAVHGLAGGAIGGVIGCIGYIVVEQAAGDLVGRLVGGLLLGLCIGLMVAVVEAAFRRAWLEVRFGPRETITVNLGPEPVKVGGDGRACTVWARGAAPLALRYFIRNGQVICEDAPTRTESVVANGDVREVGNVVLTVRTGATAAPAPPPAARPATPARPASPPPSPPPAKTEPLSLDDDLQSAATTGPEIPVLPPKPPAPAPAAPPAKPAAGPRDPDACPSCGRKNPGRAGSRYCMVCDLTY
jgi:hypothetical protein